MKKVFLILVAAALLMLFLSAGISESACGHQNTCTHPNLQNTSYWSGEITTEQIPGDTRNHMVTGDLHEGQYCPDCGEEVSMTVTEHVSREERHEFCDMNGYRSDTCRVCGYRCTHEWGTDEWDTGICTICFKHCDHPSFTNNYCDICGYMHAEINEANFPDAAFRAYVTEEYDPDHKGYVDISATGSSIEVGAEVQSVRGIELLQPNSFRWEDCTAKTLDLSGCKSLWTLTVSSSTLTSLNLSGVEGLSSLHIDCSKLS